MAGIVIGIPAGGEQTLDRPDRRGEGNVMDGRDRADEVVLTRPERFLLRAEEIRLDEGHVVQPHALLTGQPDHLCRDVHAGHRAGPTGQPADQQPVAASDVECLAARLGDRAEQERVIVNIVVPAALRHHGTLTAC
jgi:hypothetical protein